MNYYEQRLRDRTYCALMVIGSIIMAALIVLVALCFQANAETIDLDRIMMIESSGNALAHNKKEDARGLFQIRAVVLKEWNQYHRTKYAMGDLWNPRINREVGEWYLLKRIPQMLKHYGKKVTVENVIISFNAGISYVVKNKPLPKTTKKYLAKYRR